MNRKMFVAALGASILALVILILVILLRAIG